MHDCTSDYLINFPPFMIPVKSSRLGSTKTLRESEIRQTKTPMSRFSQRLFDSKQRIVLVYLQEPSDTLLCGSTGGPRVAFNRADALLPSSTSLPSAPVLWLHRWQLIPLLQNKSPEQQESVPHFVFIFIPLSLFQLSHLSSCLPYLS